MVLLFAPAAAAQVFGLGRWNGSYETVTDFARQQTRTASADSTWVQNIITQNRLTLRNHGAYLIDPRLMTFNFGGTFGLSNNWLTTDADNKSSQGLLLGYDLFTTLLPGKAFSLDAFANLDQSVDAGDIAGRIEVETENRGARLTARRLYIPSSLSFRQELQTQESRSGGVVTRQEERRNIVTYEGQRGWIDSEMQLGYEFIDSADKVTSDLSYQSHEGNFYYSLDFGPELNRRWDSRLRYFDRTGSTDLTTLNIDELLRIDHTERLRTDYRYNLMRTETTEGATTTHSGLFQLRHQLYESLTTNFGLTANFQRLPGGRRDYYRGRLDFAYTKQLPRDGTLSIGLGGGMQYDENEFGGTEAAVLQENHTAATPFALSIALNNPFVIAASVVVTKIALGPLPVGCIAPPGPPTALVLGQDYTLNTVGDITEIVPIACSGLIPGINPGDTIAVDYRVTVAPSLRFTTATWLFNVSVDYRWIRPYFIHEQQEQSLVSGTDDRFLNDEISDTIGVEFRYDRRRVRASLLTEGERFRSDRLSFDMARSNQFLEFAISRALALTANADEAFFRFYQPSRERFTAAARATLRYFPYATLHAEAFVGIRYLDDSSALTERTAESGVRVRWIYRSVEVLPSLEFFDRQRGNTSTKDVRATLRIIRRF